MGRRKKNKNSDALFFALLILVAFFIVINVVTYIWYVLASIALIGSLKIYYNLQKERRIQAIKVSEIDSMPGIQFEHYIKKLLEYRGYKAFVTPASGDLGADIIATQGEIRYAIQVKRYSNAVDRTAVSDAVASKDHYKSDQAMVVTNNYGSVNNFV